MARKISDTQTIKEENSSPHIELPIDEYKKLNEKCDVIISKIKKRKNSKLKLDANG